MIISGRGTALITGASSGIGAVYADRLAKRGYDLTLVARDTARLQAVADRLHGQTGRTINIMTADLADRAQLAKVEERITADETISLLVNNAGISLVGSLTNSPVEAVERLLAVNVVAPTLLARAAATAFSARGQGGIINISSVTALAPELLDALYSSTKALILTLSQGLARELGEKGVRVQVILPGATRTEIWARLGLDLNVLPPEIIMEAGDLVDAALLGYDRGEIVTIPPLADLKDWQNMEVARLAMGPKLSNRDVATRYR